MYPKTCVVINTKEAETAFMTRVSTSVNFCRYLGVYGTHPIIRELIYQFFDAMDTDFMMFWGNISKGVDVTKLPEGDRLSYLDDWKYVINEGYKEMSMLLWTSMFELKITPDHVVYLMDAKPGHITIGIEDHAVQSQSQV